MKQAIMEYRTHVPYNYIAIEFCDINFYGEGSERLNDMCHDFEYENLRKYEPIGDKKKEEIKTLKHKLNNLKWFNFKDKIRLREEIDKCNKELKEIESKYFKEATTLVYGFERILRNNGFFLKSRTSSNSECETITDIYEHEIDDKPIVTPISK